MFALITSIVALFLILAVVLKYKYTVKKLNLLGRHVIVSRIINLSLVIF